MIDQRKKCHACGEDAKSICSGCRIVFFCSKECQISAWPSHKGKCKAAKREAKEHLEVMWDAAHTGNIVELRKYLAKYPSAVNMVYTRNFGIMTVSGYMLDIAASNGHLEAVKLLIANGADLLLGDPDYGQLPIHRACDNGHTEVVKYLLEKGSPILEGDGMGQVSSMQSKKRYIVREPNYCLSRFY